MRHLLTVAILFTAIAILASVNRKGINLSSAAIEDAETTPGANSRPAVASIHQEEKKNNDGLWIDTVMFAQGHSFGYSGDISMWGGWYVDTVLVGYDNMLQYDSVGPSTLRLSLVTRELTVDLGDPDAAEKIKNFMNPIDGFRRFSKRFEECLDSQYYEGYGYHEYMGGFTFEVDYPDSCHESAEKINRFICELTGFFDIERANVSNLSAFYAGFDKTKNYRQVYSGNRDDMQKLSDFLAYRTFENWRHDEEFGMGSNEATLSIRPHIVNERYVTFSKYEYERQGVGHGMYTETFYTFDLNKGNKLKNSDIFKNRFLDNVKMKLFEVIAEDPHFLAWHGGSASPSEIEDMIEAWQSPSPALEGTEWEEPKRDVIFELPDCALTDAGVMFSFQPYEIDCWAAGAYHFIVPYDKLMPYLTTTAKKLISNINTK